MKTVFYISYIILLTYFISINAIYTILALASQRSNVLRIKQSQYTDFDDIIKSFLTIPVSIITPAYNEERVIVNNVYSCLKLIYPEFEVIIVNDGSNDDTLKILIEEFQLYPVDYFYKVSVKTAQIKTFYRSQNYDNLLVIDKVNSGKADSLNAGVNAAKYRYICATDADSIFAPDGMIRIMRLVLLDPQKTIAVGGQIRISNGLVVKKGETVKLSLPKKIIPSIQVIEYLRTFIANRLGWTSINALLVISGAFGLWRKDVIFEQGGFDPGTSTEDIEMTFALHHLFRDRDEDYSIVNLPDPVTWTEAPETFGDLFRQRERWQRAMIETFFKYKRMFFNPRFGTVGLLGMPYYFFYEILGPFFEIYGYILILIAIFYKFLNPVEFVLFLAVSIGYSAFISLIGLFLEQYDYDTFSFSDLPKLIILALLEPFWYRQYIDFARITATFNVLRGKKEWRGPVRKGE